jgi:TRAP-type C4-dicarboxylate transport system permease large subunit
MISINMLFVALALGGLAMLALVVVVVFMATRRR